MATLATSEIELSITANELKGKDFMSNSDPFAVLYMNDSQRPGVRREIGRTETMKDCHNVSFTKAFQLDFYFEEVQTLIVELYDRDSSSEDLSKHDFLGKVEVTLGRVMGSPGQAMKLGLQNRHNRPEKSGYVVLRGEEVATCADVIQMQLVGKKLDNKDGFFGKSDPYVTIQRSREDGSWTSVWRSETIMNNLNPTWKEFKVPAQKLCNGDYHRPIRLECLDYDKRGKHKLIGFAQTSLNALTEGNVKELALINPERQKKKGKRYKNSGVLTVTKFQIFKVPTFLEFLRGRLEINLLVGIDYTASNGAPSTLTSLHYMNPNAMNQYQMAIHATGTILQDYDADKKFPVYGFGGSVNGVVNHCFPLTFDPQNVEVEGVSGILDSYRNSLQFVSLSGPTLFAPLIATACQYASRAQHSGSQYIVLLILTDGVIMDMQQTIDTIVSASNLPLSIVIVGVGNADFSAMDELDADDAPLRSSSGQYASRDIVQFVPFNKFKNNEARLTKETLAEIPMQLTSYMASRNIRPRAPLQTSTSVANAINASHNSNTGFPTTTTAAQNLPPAAPSSAAPVFNGNIPMAVPVGNSAHHKSLNRNSSSWPGNYR